MEGILPGVSDKKEFVGLSRKLGCTSASACSGYRLDGLYWYSKDANSGKEFLNVDLTAKWQKKKHHPRAFGLAIESKDSTKLMERLIVTSGFQKGSDDESDSEAKKQLWSVLSTKEKCPIAKDKKGMSKMDACLTGGGKDSRQWKMRELWTGTYSVRVIASRLYGPPKGGMKPKKRPKRPKNPLKKEKKKSKKPKTKKKPMKADGFVFTYGETRPWAPYMQVGRKAVSRVMPEPLQLTVVQSGGLKVWNVGGMSNLALIIILPLLLILLIFWIVMCVSCHKKRKALMSGGRGGNDPNKEIAALMGFGKQSTQDQDDMKVMDASIKSKKSQDSDSPRRQRTPKRGK